MDIVILPGDDIGPEISVAAEQVLASANELFALDLHFERLDVGMAAWRAQRTTVPAAALERAIAADGVILGPCGMTEYPPLAEGGVNVPGTVRKRLDLYANLRPARSRDGVPGARAGLDVLIARENTEGFYSDRNMFQGIGEFMPTPDCALSVRKITAQASRRIAQTAFAAARARRAHVTAVGKRHVLQISDGLFIDQVREVAADYPDVSWDEMDIDAMAAEIYTAPARFDVVLVTNMFGDILSNLAVALSGSLGLAAALNAGDRHAVANAGHGSAPTLAGRNVANPSGLILSAAMLLDWLGERHGRNALREAAGAVQRAVDGALGGPASRTADLGGTLGTREFTAAVCARLRETAD